MSRPIKQLTEDQVIHLRRDCRSMPIEKLARTFGVSIKTARKALYGETFPHLPGALSHRALCATLTDQQVLEIRRDYADVSLRELARRYKVTHATVHSALHGKTFKYLPGAIPLGSTPRGGDRLVKISPETIQQIIRLRNLSSALWAYARIADKINRENGTRYAASNIQRIIERTTGIITRDMTHRTVGERRAVSAKVSIPRAVKVKVPKNAHLVDLSDSRERSLAAQRFMERFRPQEQRV